MKLHIVAADQRAKEARKEAIQKRLAPLHTRGIGDKDTNWSLSAFCEDGKHGHCSWQECKCECHSFDSDYCGHC